MDEKEFELVWLDKKKETVKGTSISDAFMKAGYSAGALRVLDTWYETTPKKKLKTLQELHDEKYGSKSR